ncbi:radical SAM protein [Cetobacterium sp.]|uniref:radical SAM protein n=1 Tax=Cetobacterium sp. TaxID=2071632 RepID=UPI003F3AF03E
MKLKNEKRGNRPIINLHLGSQCNLNCSYCFDNKNLKPLEEVQETINCLKKIIEMHEEFSFDILGSEPTLHVDKIRKILSGIDKSKIKDFNILTNGLKIEENFIKLCNDFNFKIGVSLDLGKHLHNLNRKDHFGNDTYEKIFNNILYFNKNSINKIEKIACTFDSKNEPPSFIELKKYIKDLEKLSIKKLKISFLNKLDYDDFEKSNIEKLFNLIYEFYKNETTNINISLGTNIDFLNLKDFFFEKNNIDCNARRSYTVSSDGKIYSCMLSICNSDFKNKKLFEYGTIKEHSKINKMNNLIKDYTKNIICYDCELFNFCRGACIVLKDNSYDSCLESRKFLALKTIEFYKKSFELNKINKFIYKILINNSLMNNYNELSLLECEKKIKKIIERIKNLK